MHVILVVARVGEREKDLLHNKLQNYRYFPSGDARRVPATCTHSADHMANTSKENRLAYQRTKENTQNANYVTVNWNVVNADDAWMLSVAGIRHIVAECVHQKGVNIQIHSVAHIYDRMRQTFGVRLKIKIALPFTVCSSRTPAKCSLLYRIYRNTDIMQHISSLNATDAVSQ